MRACGATATDGSEACADQFIPVQSGICFSIAEKVLAALPDAMWRTAQDICDLLQRAKLPFCRIGGLALQRWGQPLATAGVDVSLTADFARESEVVDLLLNRYQARIDDAREFAQQYRVLLLASRDGVALDISLPRSPTNSVFSHAVSLGNRNRSDNCGFAWLKTW